MPARLRLFTACVGSSAHRIMRGRVPASATLAETDWRRLTALGQNPARGWPESLLRRRTPALSASARGLQMAVGLSLGCERRLSDPGPGSFCPWLRGGLVCSLWEICIGDGGESGGRCWNSQVPFWQRRANHGGGAGLVQQGIHARAAAHVIPW